MEYEYNNKELEKILSITEEELKEIFSKMSLLEIEEIIDKLNEVKNID